MSSHQRHDKEKERMREQAQRRRAITAQSSAASPGPVAPLFDEPSKVPGSNESNKIKKQMCSILGNYDDFCSTGSKSILGVDRTPPTPQPDSSNRKKDSLFKHPTKTNNGAFREHKSSHESNRRSLDGSGSKAATSSEPGSKLDSKSNKWDEAKSIHEHKRSRDHSADASLGKSSEGHKGHHSNHNRSRMPSDGGGSEGGGGRRSHSSDRSSHSKHSSGVQSSSHHSSRSVSKSPVKPNLQTVQSPHKHHHSRQSSTSPSHSKTSSSSSGAVLSSPRKSPASNVGVFQHPLSSPASNNSPASTRPTPLESTMPPNGLSRPPLARSKNNKLPKLLMPSSENNRGSALGIEGLHDIFKEMRNIEEPVSEINTPRKSEEKLSFQIPPKSQKEPITKPNEEQDFDKPPEEKRDCKDPSPEADHTLKDDLDSSADESEAEKGATDISSGKPTVIPAQKREEPGGEVMSSASESSSEGSDSSSDSDGSSSSEGEDEEKKETQQTAPVQEEDSQQGQKDQEPAHTPQEMPSWGLKSFLNQLKKSSPEAPVAKKSSEKQKEIDETNDEMLLKVIQTDFTSPHSLKDIGHTASLPFSTDHIGSDLESERHQNGADSGSDLPGLCERINTSLGSPDNTSTCSSTSSKPPSAKPEKRGRPSLSSLSDSVHRTSKSETSVKSNSGSSSKTKSALKKDSKKGKTKSYQDERKRRKPQSKPTISDSSDSEIDVVSVTPDAKAGTPVSNSITDEDKERSRHRLFSSPKTNKSPGKPVTKEREGKSVFKDKGKDVKHRTSSHRKKDQDRDKDNSESSFDKRIKKEERTVLSPSPDLRMDVDSDKQVEDIIQDTSEFKPHGLLSPCSSPTKPHFPSPPSPLNPPSKPSLTYSNGKPTIMVDINLSFLDNIPSSANSQSASSPAKLKSSSMEAEHKSASEDIKTSELYDSKTSDNTKKSAEKSQKSVSLDKKNSSDKSLKHVDKSSKSGDRNVDRTVKSEKNGASNERSDKQAVSVECKEEEEVLVKEPSQEVKVVVAQPDRQDKQERQQDKLHNKPDKERPQEKLHNKQDKERPQEKLHSKQDKERPQEKLHNPQDKDRQPDKLQNKQKEERQQDKDKPDKQEKVSRSHKRKSESERPDSSKRHKSSSKSNKKSTENLQNGSSVSSTVSSSVSSTVSADDGRGVEVVSSTTGSSSSSKERRSSTSSTSSRHSATSSTSSSKSKKLKLEDKLKKEPASPDIQHRKEKNDIHQQNGQEHLPFTSYNESPGSATLENGPQLTPTPHRVEERLESAERYLSKAKELKHLADKDKPAKFSLYVKSVLSFVQCGCAMEKEAISEPKKIFTMYDETLQLLRQVIRVRGTCIDPDVPINDKRLSVLLLRIQSLLCLKLYNLKKSEVIKFKKIIDADNNKSNTAKSPHQSTMYNRSMGTPPPISPTPSPAGSIGSVGSQGSCDLPASKLTNGNLSANTAMSSPGTVSVSQRIHSVTQQYVNITGYFVTCLDLWQQADVIAHEFKEFFNMLDNTCGPLSLHSSVLQLVRYVNEGLKQMKDT